MNRTYLVIVLICVTILASACGQSVAPAQNETNTAQTSSSSVAQTEDKDEEAATDNQQSEKYKGVMDSLEKEDYDSAIAEIEKIKKESKAQKYGDIDNYLVTVELTKDNFDEYFEFVTMQGKNAFNEYDGNVWVGLKSKKYDEGLVLYNLNDNHYNDVITIEYTHSANDWTETEQEKLTNILSFSTGYGCDYPESLSISPTGRIAGSKLTFIKKDFVESYEIEPISSPDQNSSQATITLKNGETYYASVNPDYPY